jgi:hypothetical protein
MARFGGQIDASFVDANRGIGIVLTHVKGMPRVGIQVRISPRIASVLEIGRNSTDGQSVSTHACLRGLPTAPYGTILVDRDGAMPERLVWFEEEEGC